MYFLKHICKHIILLLSLLAFGFHAQNQARNWYFGNQAGLDFSTFPPTILTNGAMVVYEGCASISNSAGSLLFYTDGMTVYNSSHATMANGTGLFGNNTPTQSSLIVRQPGSSNLYYIFTIDGGGASNSQGFNYSIVDMSLASGSGSVIAKNVSVYSGVCSEKISAVNHCNGTDVWIVIHEAASSNFRAYLLTSSGVGSAVISSIGSNPSSSVLGALKISTNGKKIGVALFGTGSNICELHDFDATTGVVSNSISLGSGGGSYSCEFSQDGTKFYATKTSPSTLYQWDLCAGSPSAIIASQTTIATPTAALGSLQLAPNGRIYVARASQYTVGVINSPNSAGVACNYVDLGQSVFPKLCYYGLPNFNTSLLNQHPPPPAFTFTANNIYGCQTATFVAPPSPSLAPTCFAPTFSLTGMQWNFGDVASGSANTSTLTNPSHAFSALGTYTVQLIMKYSCGGLSDTLYQTVNINQPCLSVTSTSITCSSLGSATVVSLSGTGPFSYTWNPTAQTGSVATGLGPGVYTISVYDAGTSLTTTGSVTFVSNVPLTGSLSATSSVSCYGQSTATAAITNLLGGTGNPVYLWSNGTTTLNTSSVSGLGAATWSVTVTDNVSGCVYSNTFQVTQPPALTLNIATSSPSACIGSIITLSASGTGGVPSYSCNWTGGPAGSNKTVSNNSAGTYVYSVSALDANNCPVSNTVSVDFVANPVLSLSNASICPQETGTLTASGATTYTWNNNSTGASFTASPTGNTSYSVIGSALGCTSSAVASIILKPLPVVIASTASLNCSGIPINLTANGGQNYAWSGPGGYTSLSQNPVISSPGVTNTGVYVVTVTAANNCTASVPVTVTVNQSPVLSAAGSTVCSTQTAVAGATVSSGSATFLWAGPNGFSSAGQNLNFALPSVSVSGYYTVTATSTVGCKSSAIANITVTALSQSFPSNTGPVCSGSSVSLIGNTTPTLSNYLWQGPGGFFSTQQSPALSNITTTTSGIYSLTITRGPCVSTASTSLTVNPLPTPTLTSNSPVCENKKLILTTVAGPGENYTNYSWAGPSGFTDSVAVAGRDSCKLGFTGTYTVMVTDGNLCHAMASTSVNINKNPVLSIINATVCLNDPATLMATGAASYTWFYNNAPISTNASAYINSATNTAVSYYEVIGTAANNCSVSTKASVLTLTLPIASATVSPGYTTCLNNTLYLQGSGGYYYNWTGPESIQLTGNNIALLVNNLSFSGNYTLSITDTRGCRNTTTLSLKVNPLPTGNLVSENNKACVPFCADFKFVPGNNVSPIKQMQWTFGGTTQHDTVFKQCFTRAGDYEINGMIVDSNACANALHIGITAFDVPQANFSYLPEKPVENSDEVIFTNNSSGNGLTNFYWYIGNADGFKSSKPNTNYTFKSEGSYPVVLIVKNDAGCADSIIKVVTVDPEFSFYMPNAFTPNNDSENDMLIPVSRGITQLNLMIFDRWGKKLFESNDASVGWDGSYMGESCPQNIYVWKASVKLLKGNTKEYSGHVTLLR